MGRGWARKPGSWTQMGMDLGSLKSPQSGPHFGTLCEVLTVKTNSSETI